jgi:hypothetical protein
VALYLYPSTSSWCGTQLSTGTVPLLYHGYVCVFIYMSLLVPAPDYYKTYPPVRHPLCILFMLVFRVSDPLRNFISIHAPPFKSRDSSAGIALGYGLDDRGSRVRFLVGIFLFTTASRTALGPTQPPIQWVLDALSLGVKRPWREAGHSPPSSAEVKNAWSYTSIPPYVFMAWCLVKYRESFSFTCPLYIMYKQFYCIIFK